MPDSFESTARESTAPEVSGDAPVANDVTPSPPRRRRRVVLPLTLFLLTCCSTFLVGATLWSPWLFTPGSDGLIPLRRMLLFHWQDGLIYMGAVLAILFAHEMGHFLATLWHRIPASLPYFIPLPVSPIGTLGAVIGMDGRRANRKQIFDIGIAGPLAGLVVAIPILWFGVAQLEPDQRMSGMYQLDMPLVVRSLTALAGKSNQLGESVIWQDQLNPLLMAGWVGLLVTGLNMLPVSQLDGGHVIYSLFGKASHWIARIFLIAAIGYVVVYTNIGMMIMIGLILLIGTDHPPTSDDTVKLGWFRRGLGYASLLIPLVCFPLRVLMMK